MTPRRRWTTDYKIHVPDLQEIGREKFLGPMSQVGQASGDRVHFLGRQVA